MKVKDLIYLLKTFNENDYIHNLSIMNFWLDEEHQKIINELFKDFLEIEDIYNGIKNDKYYLKENDKNDYALICKEDNKIIDNHLIRCTIKDVEILYHDRYYKIKDDLINKIGLYID